MNLRHQPLIIESRDSMQIKDIKYSVIVLAILLMTSCQALGEEGDVTSVALAVVKAYVGEAHLDQLETSGSLPAHFSHPLELNKPVSISPKHVQVSLGQNAMSERMVTVVLEEVYNDLKLILVDELNQRVDIVDPWLHRESQEISANHSYTFNIEDLLEGIDYKYALYSDEAYSQIYGFGLEDYDETYKVAIFGDLQGYLLGHYTAFQDMLTYVDASQDPSLFMLMGDVVDTGSVQDQWDYYYTAMSNHSAFIPTIAAIGNHDVIGTRANFEKTFVYPGNGLEGLEESTAYYDLPNARVAVIDTERPSLFEAQQQWLGEVMASSSKPFKIVLMHRSVYPIFYVEPHMQVWAESFESSGIDLVFSGHDHLYSRTRVNDVTYVVTGSGSGSKYYDQVNGRSWQDVIYDEDQPIAVMMTIDKHVLEVTSYAYVDKELLGVDGFTIIAENE